MRILIEENSGNLPLWLAPIQVVVASVVSGANDYAKEIYDNLISNNVRVKLDTRNEKINYKIREHSLSKIPILLICGKKEVDSNSVTIRRLDSNKQESMELNLFLKKFSALNKAPSN